MSFPTRMTPTLLVSLALVLSGVCVHAEAEEGASPPATRSYTSGSREAAVPEEGSPATPPVEKLHVALLDIMRSSGELGYRGRFERISPVVVETFDLPFMAAKSMGRHWKKLPEADQQRWLAIFARHVAANYAGQFTGFSGEAFETVGEEAAIRDTRVVRTRLTRPDGDDVQLNYRLREVAGEWRIIDIYLNGTVSELALRRSEYSSVLKREGFEKLLTTIDEKVKKLASTSDQS
ncbi:MAG: ABC transporter substrate-binding protein [Myxococcota bacterium]|nr:ABC transporter substrate-binding protein [Myxococcota bacterium]